MEEDSGDEQHCETPERILRKDDDCLSSQKDTSKALKSTQAVVMSQDGGKSLTVHVRQGVELEAIPDRDGEFKVYSYPRGGRFCSPFVHTTVRDEKQTDSSGLAVYTVSDQGDHLANYEVTQAVGAATADSFSDFELKRLSVGTADGETGSAMRPSVFIYECKGDKVESVKLRMSAAGAKIVDGDLGLAGNHGVYPPA